MKTMLAARLHEIGGPFVLEPVPLPEVRPTDVLVAVKACGVVPNLKNVVTKWPEWFPHLPLPKLPAIFGLDPAGVSMYALRHTSIVRQLLANVPVRVVASGHDTSVAMIEKNYSQHITDHSDSLTRAALPDLSAPPPASNVVRMR